MLLECGVSVSRPFYYLPWQGGWVTDFAVFVFVIVFVYNPCQAKNQNRLLGKITIFIIIMCNAYILVTHIYDISEITLAFSRCLH